MMVFMYTENQAALIRAYCHLQGRQATEHDLAWCKANSESFQEARALAKVLEVVLEHWYEEA